MDAFECASEGPRYAEIKVSGEESERRVGVAYDRRDEGGRRRWWLPGVCREWPEIPYFKVGRPPRGREYLNSHKMYPHAAAIHPVVPSLKRIRKRFQSSPSRNDTALDSRSPVGNMTSSERNTRSPRRRRSGRIPWLCRWKIAGILEIGAAGVTAECNGITLVLLPARIVWFSGQSSRCSMQIVRSPCRLQRARGRGEG